MNFAVCLKALILLMKAERLASAVRRVLLIALLLFPALTFAGTMLSKRLDKKALQKKWRALLK